MTMQPKEIVFFSLSILCLWSCNDQDPTGNLQKFNKIHADLSSNYRNKRTQFDELEKYFRLNHIKTIEFSGDQIAWLQYKRGHNGDSDILKDIKNKELSSPDVRQVLQLDSISIDTVLNLHKEMERMNINRFR